MRIAVFALGLFAVLPQVGAAQTAVPGQRLYIRCQACHALSAPAPARIGPHLAGIVGRKAAAVPGYAYSPALKAKSDLVWDEATLDRWLARPAAVVPGNKMAFAGLPKPEERKALIAYLKQAK